MMDSLRTGTPDPTQANALRRRSEAIGEDAADVDAGLRDVRRQTTNPIARRLMSRILEALAGIRLGAGTILRLLDSIDPPISPSDF